MTTKEVLNRFEIREVHVFKPNINYILFLTSDRLVAAKFRISIWRELRDVLRDAVSDVAEADWPVVSFIAWLIVEPLFGNRKKRKPKPMPGLARINGQLSLDLQTVLAADKHNFEIPYPDVNKIEMKRSLTGLGGARVGKMTIFTHEKIRQFDIPDPQEFEHCMSQVRSVLPDRV